VLPMMTEMTIMLPPGWYQIVSWTNLDTYNMLRKKVQL
jgi:hypothetical protein